MERPDRAGRVGRTRRGAARAFGTSAAAAPLLAAAFAHAAAQPAAAPPPGAAIDLGTVAVTTPALNGDGSTAQSGGLYVPDPSFGPFGATPDKDIPFSTNTIPQQVLRDQQVHSAAEALKNDPSVRAFEPTNAFAQNYLIRGFEIGPQYGIFQDGLDLVAYSSPAPETDERIDILKGAASALYGFASPAGVVDYISKMPLDQALTRLDLGYISSATATEQLDASRRFGPDGEFGARVNIYQQNGDTAVDRSSSDRGVQSLALDWKPVVGLKVWGVAEHNQSRAQGGDSVFFLNSPLFRIPNAPNPLKLYGQPWDYNHFNELRAEGGFDYAADGWTVNAAGGHSETTNQYLGNFGSPSLTSLGEYGIGANRGKFTDDSTAYRALASKLIETGFVQQTISVVADGSDHVLHSSGLPRGPLQLGSFFLDQPVYLDEPALPALIATNHTNLRLNTQILSDKIEITPYVTLFGGGVRSSIGDVAYSLPAFHTLTHAYQNKITPLAAVVVKPAEWLSVYASYIQSLLPGATAPNTAVNAFQTLSPFVGEQYEVGVKAQAAPDLEINAALFQTSLAYSFLNSADVFTEDGTQTNRGFELTAAGQVLPGLTVLAGLTALDASLSKTTAAQPSSTALGVSDGRANLFAEYAVPGAPGLSVLAGVYYISRFAAAENSLANVARGFPSTVNAPSAATFDFGGRYETSLGSVPVAVRAYVENAFNKRYWVALNPGSNLAVGQPFTAKLTLSAAF